MLGIRVSDEFMKEIEEVAEKHGISKAALGTKGLELMTGFDVKYFQKIEQEAKQLNVPTWLYIQNKIIKMMALDDAETEIWGETGKLLTEFMFTQHGPVTGDQLYRELKNNYVKDEISTRLEQINTHKHHNIPLDDDDIAFLEKYGK